MGETYWLLWHHLSARVSTKTAQAAKIGQMRQFRRVQIEVIEGQLLQRLCDWTRREASQRIQLPTANRKFLDGCELGEQSSPVRGGESAAEVQLGEAAAKRT